MLNAEILMRPGVAHGFLTREGGVSEGIFASLNCGPGSGDDPAHVAENRRRALVEAGMADATLLSAYQFHSAEVAVVDSIPAEPPKADGLVTRTPGLALGILTADCAPVLLADADAGVVAALHAGWRGASAGIIANTVDAMVAQGARLGTIAAAIGPCIHPAAYEVGADMRDAALAGDSACEPFFCRADDGAKWLFDLPGYVGHALTSAGIEQVADVDADTYGDEQRFFSFRRTTHRGEGDKGYGRQLSVIALSDDGGGGGD